VRTVTVGLQTVLSSLFAPTLILGGVPVRPASRLSAACVKSFRLSVPLQSGQRSCSMLKESSVDATGEDDGGARTGTETGTADALDGAVWARAPATRASESRGSSGIGIVARGLQNAGMYGEECVGHGQCLRDI
jgi:hypothetical protein